MFKLSQNTFNKGLNNDIDPRVQNPATYRDAKNISITGDGDFFSAKNIKSSKVVSEISSLDSEKNILGAFECVGTYCSYGSEVEKNPSVVIFLSEMTGNQTKKDSIILFDTVKCIKHVLLETFDSESESINGSLTFPFEGTIDAVVFGENNVDKIYFDDESNPLRTFDITDKPIDNAKSILSVNLAPVDEMSYVSQINGSGQNASGTYQFSYRYYNSLTKKHTTWSLLTNPIPVYPLDFSDVDTLDEIYGGLPNEVTRKSIVLSINKTDRYSLNFDSIQLAVIKNTGGLKQPSTVAFLTAINKDWFSNPERIVYDGSGLEESIDSQEVVTEDAPISSAKTVTAKDNVLFRGNINYFDREVDEISFGDAETISKKMGASGSIYASVKKNPFPPSISTNVTNSRELFVEMVEGETFITKSTIGFNSFLDIREQVGDASNTVAGDKTNWSKDTELNFRIDSIKLSPGNIIFFRAYYTDVGMREWPGPTGGDQWGFDNDLVNYVGNFANGAPINSKPTPEGLTSILSGYVYVVRQGDTIESVRENVFREISPSFDNGFTNISFDDGYIKIRVEDRLIERVGINNNRRTAVWVQWGAAKGSDFSVSDTQSELDDLINNEDSIFGGYKNPKNSVDRKGYFRDEVYRYGLVYQDDYGNWSRPKALDFSSLSARTESGEVFTATNISLHNLSDGSVSGMTSVKLSTSGHGISVGDGLFIEISGEKFFSQVTGINPQSKDFIYIKGSYTSSNALIHKCIGGQYSWSDTGIDWKFPKRDNALFPMMTTEKDEDNTFINPIGLKITGINNHPEWANSLAVVRVKRSKNIIWQSPHITASAVMPALGAPGCDPESGSSPDGTYMPKSFSKGFAFSFSRNNPRLVTDPTEVFKRILKKDNLNVPKLSVVVPPEYMYQNDNEVFGSSLFPVGAYIEMVDLITAFRTPSFDVDGSGSDSGNNEGDQLAFGIRADNAMNYYYKDISGFVALDSFSFEEDRDDGLKNGQFSNGGKTLSLFYGQIQNNGSGVSLPSPPADVSFRLKNVDSYGELESTSVYNCSNEVSIQKQAIVMTKDVMGDVSAFVRSESPDFNFSGESFRGGDLGITPFWNLSESVFDNVEQSGSSPTEITSTFNGATAAIPVVNLVRDINDDRYGSIIDTHQYIHTGAYSKINSKDESIDIEVWGGDCFISKHVAKISNTTLDVTNGFNKAFAYPDYQEVLMMYLESEVNCEMQADQFIYPVVNKNSLPPFNTTYTYPYNPGYSVENELKIWVSKDISENNRIKFPSRVVFSDQKIFQTDVEGFDRFRAFSFFDLPEDRGSITKLIKLPNENVYSIQESSVVILPINKNVLEDSLGGQLVVNSDTLINKPSYIMNQNGSQHIRSVKVSDNSIFFMDANKKEVFKIGGGSGVDGKISEIGLHSSFDRLLKTINKIPDNKIVSGYDYNNSEYWIGVKSHSDLNHKTGINNDVKQFQFVWSDKMSFWTTEILFNENTSPEYLTNSVKSFFLLGEDYESNMILEEVYEGEGHGTILGSKVHSEISLVINSEESFGKTFDVLRIDSNNRLTSAKALVFKEDGMDNQETSLNLNRKPRHDGYEVPMLLDSKKGRLRGKYCILSLLMDNVVLFLSTELVKENLVK